ncbi:lytic transglycosylase (plasmid) [Priestia aryabhattai]
METNNIAATTNAVTNTSSTLPIKQISGNTTYDPTISEMAQKYNVPFNLIKAVINAESSFNPNATSSTGAMGLMQLMPSTAKWLGVNDAYNARENIEGGAKYLSYLLKRFDGDFKLAVAGYNAGPGNVEKYKGIPPFQETQNYVKKILT